MEIKEIIGKMTAEEKIDLCNGDTFWSTKAFEQYGVPSLFMCDGPSGLRKQEREGGADMLGVNESRPATCFPLAVTAACSWDEKLMEHIGQAIGEEAREQQVGLVLGPGVNMKRNPLCGRNFEYFSEDPELAGKLAAGLIRGLESQKIGSCLKHFACNSQEKSRFNSDSIVDERALREIYLRAFEIAVKEANPSAIMSAYVKLNGIHCSDNKVLLDDILRKEWGFQGMVVTDWGGMNDRIAGFEAGNDLSMPGGSDYMKKEVLQALEDGRLSMEALDRCAERILSLAFRAEETLSEEYSADQQAHHELAVEAARQSAVLLKNENGILPLSGNEKVLIAGWMAQSVRYQGAGSSHINAACLEQPLRFFPEADYARGCTQRGDTDDDLLKELEEKAAKADRVIVFAGLPERYESEGFDRTDMKMPEGHIRMIETACRANPETIVVLLCGSPVECAWADDVRAVLYMGLAGEGCAQAAHDLIIGKACPCGKLAETWPLRYEDVPSSSFYGNSKDALYMESIYIGYRYYDKALKNVRWPFGYGLSYTSFAYSDLKISGDTVSFHVKNTGSTAASEIAQLYISSENCAVHRPQKELKRFAKVFLEPGQEKEIIFELDDRCFAIWHEGWVIPEGNYSVMIGSHSRNLPLSAAIEKSGEQMPEALAVKDSWYETCRGSLNLSQWEALLGRKYYRLSNTKGNFTMDNTVEEMKDSSLVMKIMYKAVEKTVAKGFDGKTDYENPEFRMLMSSSAGSPLRSMQISGGIKGGVMPGLLEMANGHYIKGIIRMIRG